MPLYDFVCKKCGHAFEALVMGSDQPVCPKCRSTELGKRMSTFSARTGRGEEAGGGSGKCAGCTGQSCRTCR